jgi:hypothetical protein
VTPCCPTYWRSASSVLFNAFTPWSVAGSGVGVGAGVGLVIVATGERRGRKRFTRPNEPDRDYGGRRPDSSSDPLPLLTPLPHFHGSLFRPCRLAFGPGTPDQQTGGTAGRWAGPLPDIVGIVHAFGGPGGILRPTGTNLGTELGSIGDEYTAQ